LLDPRPEHIRLEDIIESLSKIPRYLGHTLRPLTVAEHSIRLERAAVYMIAAPDPNTVRREALLHDAHEAYTGDMVRMLKQDMSMARYRIIQWKVDIAIRQRFGLKEAMSDRLVQLDKAICRLEIRSDAFPENWRPVKFEDNGIEEDAAHIQHVIAGNQLLERYGWNWELARDFFESECRECGLD